MEVLDQLYGVTMQEGGVSTVIGVDMKKDIPEHLKRHLNKRTHNKKRTLKSPFFIMKLNF